jgi:hypothetical protein
MQVNCGKINKYITEIEKKKFFENCGNAMRFADTCIGEIVGYHYLNSLFIISYTRVHYQNYVTIDNIVHNNIIWSWATYFCTGGVM